MATGALQRTVRYARSMPMIQDVRDRLRAKHCAAVFATIACGLAGAGMRARVCPTRDICGRRDLFIHHQAAPEIAYSQGESLHVSSIGRQIAAARPSSAFFVIVILAATLASGCKDRVGCLRGTRWQERFGRSGRRAKRRLALPRSRRTVRASVSHIEGDRMQSIPKAVMSKQTESSPFRFAEIAKEAGIDFVHFSGMTDEKHFPTANGSGAAVFDYRRRRPARHLLRDLHALAAGNGREGAEPALQEPGRQPFQGRDRVFRPGLPRLLPRNHHRRHRQRRRSGRLPVQLRLERSVPE